jgi:hypothetical protein
MGKHARKRSVFGGVLDLVSKPAAVSRAPRLESVAPSEPPATNLRPRRRGVVYDDNGRELGSIHGDGEIGYFASSWWGAEHWFMDVATAEAALVAEARSRAPGRYSAAS